MEVAQLQKVSEERDLGLSVMI